MSSTLHQRLLATATLEAADAHMLLERARALRRAAKSGGGVRPLRGKHIALLCARPDGANAREFDTAARELGARVSRVESGADWARDDAAPEAAHLLARLYDAIGCEDVPAGLASRLEQRVGLPVFDGLASDAHPVAQLVPRFAADAAHPDPLDRRFLLQAVLVEALA